jgi:hypothetical protein
VHRPHRCALGGKFGEHAAGDADIALGYGRAVTASENVGALKLARGSALRSVIAE